MLKQVFKSLLVFFNREYISCSAQYIFRKYWQEYNTLCLNVITGKKIARANLDEVVCILAEKAIK